MTFSSSERDRILVVDDDDAARELLVAQVRHMGYDCDEAPSGPKLLALARFGPPPALVLSDMEMPSMSGLQLLRALLELGHEIQVVMVTARDDLTTARKCLRAGAYDYLTKPYDLEELSQTIGRALERRRLLIDLGEQQQSLERQVREKTREVRATRDIALLAVAKLAECRDETTGYHLERMQWYSRILAETMAEQSSHDDGRHAQVTAEFADHLFKSSPLHDIGKVAIPDSILLKAGSLTAEEWAVMKTHTTRGGDTLRDVIESSTTPYGTGFLRMAMEVAYHHHERWDGHGYPQGTEGDDIPLAARIVALADAYDAIRSDRPYKQGVSHAEATERIVADRLTHFDPGVVDAYLRCERKFELISRQMRHPSESGSRRLDRSSRRLASSGSR